jgi:histidyl-tRNA synthetase
MIKAPRGTRDILPPDTALWDFIEFQAQLVFEGYNFREIRTPIFESTELFARGVGEETDIVGKEMFTWEDKARAQSEKSQSLTLRPENTAGVVRAYIEHKLSDTGMLQKLYYIGPQFRRERPQKGRYRQFYQIGAEAIGPPSSGSESPVRDAEVIAMLVDLLKAVGIKQWELHINSVGDQNCRPAYNTALREALKGVVNNMCADCQRRAVMNPLRVLDCKVPEDQPIIDQLPKILDYLDDACRENFAAVRALLDVQKIPYTVNPRMVRGLDYYQRFTFEFLHGGLGAQSALLGGGRYDGLSEALGGPKAPGVGFALGLDRFVIAAQAEGVQVLNTPEAYIAPLGPGMNAVALQVASELRGMAVVCDLGDETFRIKKTFEMAERIGAQFVVIVGEEEANSGVFTVKDIRSGEQKKVPRAELFYTIRPGAKRTSFD